MNSYFQHTKVKRALSINKKSIIILFIVLAVLLVSSAIIEYKSSKNELIEVLQEQSLALVASLEQGSVNAIQSFQVAEEILAERLLGLARLIEEIDYNDKLSLQLITKIAAENNIFRINVFDKNGNKVISNAGGMGTGRNSRQNASEYLLEKIKNNDELLIGFGQRRFGTAQRFAVAKKRRNGGVLVLNIDATEILDYRKTIGAGKLYKDIGESNGIEYTVLQDSTGILLASQNVDSLSSIYSDEFLQKSLISGEALTRILLFKGVYVFEIVKPLYVNENFQGLMRIGLSAQHLKDVEAGAKARIILASIILLIIGSVVIGFVISNQNYHELQKAYSRIETYTGSILTNMNDAVIAVDHNENISIFNKAAEKLFQVNAKDILNKKCDSTFKTFCPLLLTALKNSENDTPQIYNIHINNQEYIISLSTTIIRNDKGKIDTSFAVIKDITEQKTLEENLKRKDQITAMGHLASGVAHEIRNPLNAISIIAQRFRQEFKPVSEADEYNKLASSMVDQTRRINTIIQQFLKMARPGSLSKSTTNMNNVINQVVTLIKSVAKSKNIKLIENCSELPEISVDSDMIQQALLNIVQNSLDACEQNDTVELNCTTVHDNLEIRISDTGHGISKDELHKIFNMYYTTKQEGTGLGLSVVQQIISLHNGTIQVQSEIDKGTVFIIHLPLAE